MILPVPSGQYPSSLTGRVGRMHHSFPSACLFGGWGTLLPLCELFLDTAASELTVRDISGHHNPRSKRGKKGKKENSASKQSSIPYFHEGRSGEPNSLGQCLLGRTVGETNLLILCLLASLPPFLPLSVLISLKGQLGTSI